VLGSSSFSFPRVGHAPHRPTRRASTLNGFNEIPPLLDIASQTILQSESDLSSQLNVARKMRSRDLPEARIVESSINRTEIRVVEGVEELGTQLEREAFVELHVLDQP
jgi:hypothetical protein